MSVRCWCLIPLLASLATGAQLNIVRLRIEPGSRILQNADSHQQLMALGTHEDGNESDVTDDTKWTLSPAGVVEIAPGGVLKAVGNGKVTVMAEAEGHRAQAQFEVRNASSARPFEFAHDIGGIFTRKGCNGSTCHGGVKGRGGFKLSAGGLYPKD